MSHLGGDNGRGDGPDGGGGGTGGRPQDAVGLDSKIGGQEPRLAVAAEGAELQVQVHLHNSRRGQPILVFPERAGSAAIAGLHNFLPCHAIPCLF